MISDLAKKYFDPIGQRFFRWEDDGSVLIWDNGTTIAFQTELANVMRRLAPECLPPWTAIATLLSACRDNWPDARALLIDSTDRTTVDQNVFDTAQPWESVLLTQIVEELDQIHGLSKQLRHSLTARCELAAMVFEQQIGIFSEDDAQHLAALVADGIPVELQPAGGIWQLIQGAKHDFEVPIAVPVGKERPLSVDALNRQRRESVSDLVRDLRWLRGAVKSIDGEELRRRIRTGVEDLPTSVATDDRPSVRQLISDLMEDEQLGGVARVAQRMLAIVALPRQLAQPDELPIGGVTDVTNRGALDKLLPTELAHDDLTLAVRVAANEAMYFRRESPPAQRSLTRYALIDIGLTMWGIPRILATAAALAMEVMNDEQVDLKLYRSGLGLSPVDLTTREGIEQHLEQLDTVLEPSASLSRLEKLASADTSDDSAELIVITSHDAAETNEFRQQLQQTSTQRTVFLLTVSRSGDMQFSQCTQRGRRPIRTVVLEIDRLLHRSESSARLIRGGTATDFPAICSLSQFPLRLSTQASPEQCFLTPLGAASVTQDGRLLVWDVVKAGGRQLSDQLGRGRILWQGWTASEDVLFVYGLLPGLRLQLVTVNLDRAQIRTLNLREAPLAVSGFAGTVFLIYHSKVDVFTPHAAEAMATVPIPEGMVHCPNSYSAAGVFGSATSRFFMRDEHLYALSPTVMAADFVSIGKIQVLGKRRTCSCFDCRGEGIVVVNASGQQVTLRCLWNDQEFRLNTSQICVSTDGRKILYTNKAGVAYVSQLLDGRLVVSSFLSRQPFWGLTEGRTPYVESTYRRHIRSIGLIDNQLILTMKKGYRLLIDVSKSMAMQPSKLSSQQEDLPFEAVDAPSGTCYELKQARWEDGSRAFLDSRGLLHLISSQPQVPQMTLVLSDGRISGWIEGHGAFGTKYHQLDGTETKLNEDRQVLTAAIEGFVRCLK